MALALVVELGDNTAAIERVTSRLAAREPGAPIASVVPPFGPGMAPIRFTPTFPASSALGLMAEHWAQLDPERVLTLTRDFRDEALRLALRRPHYEGWHA